ncbi:MAG: flagellar biosynthesis anti-sigma factor FlgM [bacterium]|jgi:flagellar biosynthesis anti-sigma factor FlgM
MKISGKQVQGAVQSFLCQVNKTEKGATGGKAACSGGDRVDLSPQAAEMQKVKDLIKAVPDVRRERVEGIKAALAAGEYQVSPAEVAVMMIGRSIADNLK